MGIEIDPVTGAPIVTSGKPAPFTIADDAVKSVSSENDSVAQALDELDKTMDETAKRAETDEKATTDTNEAKLDMSRNSAGQVLERPTNTPANTLKSKLTSIRQVLRNGMDSQQQERAMKEITKILED